MELNPCLIITASTPFQKFIKLVVYEKEKIKMAFNKNWKIILQRKIEKKNKIPCRVIVFVLSCILFKSICWPISHGLDDRFRKNIISIRNWLFWGGCCLIMIYAPLFSLLAKEFCLSIVNSAVCNEVFIIKIFAYCNFNFLILHWGKAETHPI